MFFCMSNGYAQNILLEDFRAKYGLENRLTDFEKGLSMSPPQEENTDLIEASHQVLESATGMNMRQLQDGFNPQLEQNAVSELLDTFIYYRNNGGPLEAWYLDDYTYDSERRVIEVQDWDSLENGWTPHIRETFAYNTKEQKIDYQHFIWKDSAWCNDCYGDYEYASWNDSLIRFTLHIIPSSLDCDSSFFEKFRQIIYVYDPNTKQKVEQYYLRWSGELNTWVNELKYAWTYDADLRLTSESCFIGNLSPTTWSPDTRYEYSYTQDGEYNEVTYWEGNGNTLEWEEVRKETYSYYTNGWQEEILLWTWENDSLEWVWKERYTYSYNWDGELVLKEYDDWRPNTSSWFTEYYWEYTYNDDGRILESRRVSTHSNVESALVYTYDGDGHLRELRRLFDGRNMKRWLYDYTDLGNVSLHGEENWNADIEEWITAKRYIYKYQPFVNATNIEDKFEPTIDVTIYPVPSESELTVVLPKDRKEQFTITLFDISGRIVKAERMKLGQSQLVMNVNRIPHGLYWVHIQGDSGIAITRQIIIQH